MLTKSRADTLEQHYKLIDFSCNAKIKSLLERGEPDEAATKLIEYFKKNHIDVDLLQFCEFLRDEAKEAGRGAVLLGLANWIERAVKAQRPSGITQHYVNLFSPNMEVVFSELELEVYCDFDTFPLPNVNIVI